MAGLAQAAGEPLQVGFGRSGLGMTAPQADR
jgi:hypothetical protein